MTRMTSMMVYAILSAIIGSIVVIPIMYMDPEFDIKTYTFWPYVALGFFITSLLVTLAAPHVFKILRSK
jgi:hypothetical protein